MCLNVLCVLVMSCGHVSHSAEIKIAPAFVNVLKGVDPVRP